MKEKVTITYDLDEVLKILKKEYLENREIYNDSIEVTVLIAGVNTQDPNEVIAERRQYVDKIRQMVNEEHRIAAIKMLRADHNLGLKQARDFTEVPSFQEHYIKTGKFLD